MIRDFWRPVSAEMQTGFGVPLGVCMERAQVLFSPRSPRFLAPLKSTAWCFWCRVFFPPKLVGKQFWGNWDSNGNSSVWIGKIHRLMVHFFPLLCLVSRMGSILPWKECSRDWHPDATCQLQEYEGLLLILGEYYHPMGCWMSVSSETGLPRDWNPNIIAHWRWLMTEVDWWSIKISTFITPPKLSWKVCIRVHGKF